MREPGAILLIACYELGHQPLAVAWPAAFLEARGYAPAVLDISVEPFDSERVRRARVVAISVPMHTALRLGTTVARRVRDVNPGAHVCFFGLYATLNAEHLLSHDADSVLGGEIENALVELIQQLERDAGAGAVGLGQGHRDHEAGDQQTGRGWAPSRASRPVASRRERVSRTRAQPRRPDAAPSLENGPRLEKLSFAVPSRGALPALKQYAHLERNGRLELAGYVEASRGCKHLCRHCPIPPVYGGRFFVVPREIVLADIRQLVGAGARHVTFGDPDFLNGPGHAMAVARMLHREFPDLTFDFTAKVEHLLRHRTLLPELAALGAIFVVSAVESLSDAVLVNLAKGHTRGDVAVVLEAVRAAGIAFRPTWVPFTPWTTLGDYREMLTFVEDQRLIDHVDAVQYSIRLLVPPGSLLLDSPAMRPHLGPLVEEGFYYRWTHPDPRVDRLQETVAQMVAAAADQREDAAVTFARIRALADSAAGLPPSPALVPVASERPRPPRLTEPWFC